MRRRSFLALLGAGMASALLPTPRKAEAAAPSIDGMLIADPTCLQYVILGYCYAFSVPVGYLVRHFLPVAFVETVKGVGDSILSPATTPLTGTRVRENESQGFEVRIWEIPELMRRLVLPDSCWLCPGESGKSTYNPIAQLSEVMEKANVACGGPTTAAIRELIKKAWDAIAAGALKLVYSSEEDPVNWRTGCRDLPVSTSLAYVPVTCAAGGVLQTVGKVAGVDLSIPGTEFCVGTWGSVFPRQYRAQGLTEFVGSGMAAYRALHIAAYTIDTFDFPVNTGGKLQPVYPMISKCFFPGDSPAIADFGRVTSPNGNYGYIYWVPVTCCIPFGQIASCI